MQVDALEPTMALPLEVLVMLFNATPGAQLEPATLVARLRGAGFVEAANGFAAALAKPGFWQTQMRACFPRVTQLPAYIEEALQAGRRYYNVPAEAKVGPMEPRLAIDQAWRDAFRHVLLVLRSTMVRFDRAVYDQATASSSFVALPQPATGASDFVPSLHFERAAGETCDQYVNREHTRSETFAVANENEAEFRAHLNWSVYGDDDEQGMSDDEIDVELGYDDLPTLGAMARRLDSGGGSVAELLLRQGANNGAKVYSGSVPVPEPFDRVVDVDYTIRWAIRLNALPLIVQSVLPTQCNLTASMEARATVKPWLVDDAFLYAVDLRQARRRSRQWRDTLPFRYVLHTDGGGLVAGTLQERINGRTRTRRLVDAVLRELGRTVTDRNVMRALNSAGKDGLVVSMFSDFGVAANNTELTFSNEIVLADESRPETDKVYVGELLGPVRPHRPVGEGATGYSWYAKAKRDSAFTVHVRFR